MSDVTVFPLLPHPPLLFEIIFHFPTLTLLHWFHFLHQTLDEDLAASNNNNMWQNRPVAQWSTEQVCLWLTAMSMDEYASEFTAKGVNGTELLLLDGEKLKVRENWSGPIFLILCFMLLFNMFRFSLLNLSFIVDMTLFFTVYLLRQVPPCLITTYVTRCLLIAEQCREKLDLLF